MLRSAPDNRLAKAFWRTGWVGFWIQLAILLICIGLAVYALIADRNAGIGTRGQLGVLKYLTIISLLILAFTTFWSFRYILLAGRIADPARCPSASDVRRTVGIGVGASTVGLIVSMVIMLFEVTQLFLYFLNVPKAGVPVIQTTSGPATWVSAGDILNFAILVFMTFIEVIVLALGLWLLFRASTSEDLPHLQPAE
ncbi:DUF3611 family protein [Mesorhizobium sp. BAC0120]|uniref:DUF3611 family protein n=1 Tax=Mesorhizobium sp. BAC0120 TaxID=3090670 RepID=UPI00298CDA30|nr:DUF3611 family protein [Mesorhizobium sp. BAC0120]MDW6023492.1 DUF3611 family protein [Mesorhizobium sp. BAC0120]